MLNEDSQSQEIIPETCLSSRFLIQRFEQDGEAFYLIGFDKEDGSNPSMFLLDELGQVPAAMFEWGKIILINELGWVPPEISNDLIAPKKKLILPGQN